MELDELKKTWASVDERLKKNESLKDSIILEMMKSKAEKIVNRFIAIEIISATVLFFVIPFCVFWLDKRGGRYLITDITMFSAIIVCLLGSFWEIYKINGLMKIDLAKNVGNNIYYVNKYNIQIKREFKFVNCFIGPVFGVLIILVYASMKVTMSRWVYLFCALIAMTFILYWLFKIYTKGIDSILQSLAEMNELQEE